MKDELAQALVGCEHNWVPSKIWVRYERTYEEPKFYPPSGLLNLEICTKCGTLRVTPKDVNDSLKEK